MRSRYCAYVEGAYEHVLASWDPLTRPTELALDSAIRWLDLRVIRVEQEPVNVARAVVEFVARYRINGRGFRLHEISQFRLIDSHWFYTDGTSGD
ncbi:MAG: SEC-C motif-containing protein [Gammaproteobacteria bacterium]|jgi:SEC-C motif-containing protein